MFRRVSKTIFLTLIFFLSINAVSSDDLNAEKTLIIPHAELITTYQGRDPYIFFYPYGWSKNGAFAYLTEVRSTPFSIALTTRYEAVIVDTTNNKVLWNHKITKNSETCTYFCIKSDQPASLERVWPEFLITLKPQLIKHSIVRTESLSLNSLPFPKIGKNIASKLTKDFNESQGRYFVKQFTVSLDGKLIVSLSQQPYSVDVNLQGYFSSPFAEHYALILEEFRLGQHYEKLGPYFLVAGINMKALLIQNE